jgi:HK97 family phage major capsid protein
MAENPLEIREKMGELIHQARELVVRHEGDEPEEWNSEDETTWQRMMDEADVLRKRAERIEQQERSEAALNALTSEPFKPEPEAGEAVRSERREATDEYGEAFESMLRAGPEHMDAEQRATLQVDLDIGGGYLAASERFINKMMIDVDTRLAIRAIATVYRTSYEESLGWPSLDGDISDFVMAGELTSGAEDTGIAFGKRELKPRALKRKLVKISKRLLESPRLNTEGIVVERVGVALARTCDQWYMTGNGAEQPLGLFTASDNGIGTGQDYSTGNTSTALKPNGLIGVQGELAEAYQAKARWLFHRDAITNLRKFTLGDGQLMWQPGLQKGVPDVLLGKPYIVGSYVPNTFEAEAYVGMYGDFKYYWIADGVENMVIQRLLEMYALTGQVGLLFDKLSVDAAPVLAEAFIRIQLDTA